MNRYVRAAIDTETNGLRNSSAGRACAAFRAAAAIGGFVGAGAIDHAEAEHLLLAAALETGLPEREAHGHIRRGLRRGEQTPRSLPDANPGGRSRSFRRPPSSVTPANPPFEEPPAHPPKAEVDALWNASVPVSSDPEVLAWFHYRYQAAPIVELAEAWDLARAVPPNLDTPRWAWSRAGSWARTGHRILFRLWDHTGHSLSLRARCIDPATGPKSLAPAGFSVKELVLADPLGVQLLAGATPDWWQPREVVIAEGEPDFLTWAARQSDSQAQGPACFGIEAGAWSQQIADRIPDGARVAIRTHNDEPGERYAAQIANTLRGRCHLFRSQAEEEALR